MNPHYHLHPPPRAITTVVVRAQGPLHTNWRSRHRRRRPPSPSSSATTAIVAITGLVVASCRLIPSSSSPLSFTAAATPPTTESPRLVLPPPCDPPPPHHRRALCALSIDHGAVMDRHAALNMICADFDTFLLAITPPSPSIYPPNVSWCALPTRNIFLLSITEPTADAVEEMTPNQAHVSSSMVWG